MLRDVWFSTQLLGKNAISNLAKRMSEAAGFEKKINHSRRKTTVQTLLRAEVPPTSIMQLTGHKNVQSLNSYSSLSILQQQQMSNTLSSLLLIQPSLCLLFQHQQWRKKLILLMICLLALMNLGIRLATPGGAASDNGSSSLASVNTPAATIWPASQ
jgi:hypothetical protein